jgi:hypothetical protein
MERDHGEMLKTGIMPLKNFFLTTDYANKINQVHVQIRVISGFKRTMVC